MCSFFLCGKRCSKYLLFQTMPSLVLPFFCSHPCLVSTNIFSCCCCFCFDFYFCLHRLFCLCFEKLSEIFYFYIKWNSMNLIYKNCRQCCFFLLLVVYIFCVAVADVFVLRFVSLLDSFEAARNSF